MSEIRTNNDEAMKVLVADGSEPCQGICQTLLHKWGFIVMEAKDGQDALTIYEEGNGPLLMLLDWEMPGVNGVEVCHRIRQMPSIAQPYIMMVATEEEGSFSVQALDAGADDFVSKPFNEDELRARLNVGKRTITLQHHLRKSLAHLEDTMREKAETEGQLHTAFLEMKGLVASISMILIAIDNEGRINLWNKSAEQTFGFPSSSVVGTNVSELTLDFWNWPQIMTGIMDCENTNRALTLTDVNFKRSSGGEGVLRVSINPLVTEEGTRFGLLLLAEDITEFKQLETQLNLAQKMESIGQLAAGIAHEINTPIQFVSDNLRFLTDSFVDIQKVLDVYDQVMKAVPRDVVDSQLLAGMDSTLADADLAYVQEEVPKALQQSLDGSERVGHIVRAMKDFSHPGTSEKMPVDLNQAIESTITVAQNEWKYVAEMVTDLDSTLPLVPCLPGEFNQVVLNLVINAAHAIGAVIESEAESKGTITVTTKKSGDHVEIRIMDTGSGIPESARNRIFDPFFTTKEVGKGTGQGLAIAHDVIVNKHTGNLTFETEVGRGTTFIIQLPCELESAMEKSDETSHLVCR